MNFVEVSINICVALLAAVIFGGLVAAVITSLAKPSPEVVPAIVIVCMVLTFAAVEGFLVALRRDFGNLSVTTEQGVFTGLDEAIQLVSLRINKGFSNDDSN